MKIIRLCTYCLYYRWRFLSPRGLREVVAHRHVRHCLRLLQWPTPQTPWCTARSGIRRWSCDKPYPHTSYRSSLYLDAYILPERDVGLGVILLVRPDQELRLKWTLHVRPDQSRTITLDEEAQDKVYVDFREFVIVGNRHAQSIRPCKFCIIVAIDC